MFAENHCSHLAPSKIFSCEAPHGRRVEAWNCTLAPAGHRMKKKIAGITHWTETIHWQVCTSYHNQFEFTRTCFMISFGWSLLIRTMPWYLFVTKLPGFNIHFRRISSIQQPFPTNPQNPTVISDESYLGFIRKNFHQKWDPQSQGIHHKQNFSGNTHGPMNVRSLSSHMIVLGMRYLYHRNTPKNTNWFWISKSDGSHLGFIKKMNVSNTGFSLSFRWKPSLRYGIFWWFCFQPSQPSGLGSGGLFGLCFCLGFALWQSFGFWVCISVSVSGQVQCFCPRNSPRPCLCSNFIDQLPLRFGGVLYDESSISLTTIQPGVNTEIQVGNSLLKIRPHK